MDEDYRGRGALIDFWVSLAILAAGTFLIFAVLLRPDPAAAFYTSCKVLRETVLATRPGGWTEPRWSPIKAGGEVAIRDTIGEWAFVYAYIDEREQYGWLRRSDVAGCRLQEGTP